jgi:hypothetical protein
VRFLFAGASVTDSLLTRFAWARQDPIRSSVTNCG